MQNRRDIISSLCDGPSDIRNQFSQWLTKKELLQLSLVEKKAKDKLHPFFAARKEQEKKFNEMIQDAITYIQNNKKEVLDPNGKVMTNDVFEKQTEVTLIANKDQQRFVATLQCDAVVFKTYMFDEEYIKTTLSWDKVQGLANLQRQNSKGIVPSVSLAKKMG